MGPKAGAKAPAKAPKKKEGGGGKAKKKKWSKGKSRDKLNNLVLFDKGTYDKLYKEVPTYKLITKHRLRKAEGARIPRQKGSARAHREGFDQAGGGPQEPVHLHQGHQGQ